MSKQGHIIDKSIPPMVKTWPLLPEHLSISYQPDIPASSENHLSKERFGKIPPSMKSNFRHRSTQAPINLQVGPYTLTEITCEEKVVSILPRLSWEKHTLYPIINMPVPSLHHILCV